MEKLNSQTCPSWFPGLDGLKVGGVGLEVTELTVAAAHNWPPQPRE